MRCVTNVKIRLSRDPEANGFGKGIVQLLEGVERLGSINRATKEMGMAYSKAWKIVNAVEQEFGIRLIARDGARGSGLTPEAKEFIARYHEIQSAAQAAAEEVFRKYYGEPEK